MADRKPHPPLDILLTLALALRAWWRDFAPLLALGAVLVSGPWLARMTAARDLDPGGATVVTTLQGVGAMLYLSAVAYGLIHQFARKPLRPGAFILRGLAAAQPGLVVALLLGAALVTVAILFLVARLLPPLGGSALQIAAAFGALWGAATLLPAVPAAVAERLGPVAALERAAELTRGNRLRVVGLLAVVAAVFVPFLAFVGIVVFGERANGEDIGRALHAMTPSDPGLWIQLLAGLLVAGVLVCVPPALYAMLVAAEPLKLRR